MLENAVAPLLLSKHHHRMMHDEETLRYGLFGFESPALRHSEYGTPLASRTFIR